MPPAVATETTETGKNGEIMERSSEDGQLYSKPTVGIIYPPPEVRNIVDRTANFVARNGPEFEERIRGNEINNPKFNFLNPNDPYNAYYQHKLKEFREGDLSQPEPQSVQAKDLGKAAPTTQNVPQVLETIIPKDPPPNHEFTIDPPTISAIDLDIVKLTAQFVAKNGKSFLTNLMTREQRNYQFDFLRPQHSLFQYFTRLVEQYTKVLLPPADISKTLTEDIVGGWKILDRVKYRVEWQKYQDREKRKEEDVKERERIAFAQIDWHDFVVVETVNFREEETANLPPPVTKDQLGTRLLAQERINKNKEGDEEEVVGEEQDDEEEEELYQPFVKQQKDDEEDKAGSDMEEESDNEEDQEDTTPIMPPPKAPPAMPANATIRKNYDPKAQQTPQQKTTEKFLISPLTGEKVPAESMDSHMKINLLDPRWKEQKEKAIEEKRQQERVFAEGVHIGDTLKLLAERRSDIFGVGTEETLIGKKIGEEEAPKKLGAEIWDGHSSSMERATKIAHSNITFEDQIKAIHKAKGLLPSEDAEKIGPAIPSNPSSSSASSSTSLPPPPVPPISTSRPSVSDSAPKPPVIRPTPPVVVKAPPQKPPMQRPPMPRPPMPMPPPNMPRPPMAGMMPPRPPMMNMGPPPPMMMMGPPPPGAMMPPPNFMPPPIQPPPTAPMVEEESDEPQSKKQKMDDLEAGLVSEQEFLQNNRLPVTFRVQVPDLPDKTEWQCQGQVLKIVFSLTTPCSVIKSKITEMIGMPVGKQKLQLGNFFIKDSNSLAFYNFDSSSLVQLQVKERGGRKK